MPTTHMLRASYTFDASTLMSFNALFPPGERSRVMQRLMKQALSEREARLEKIAAAFMADSANTECIADEALWDVTAGDGLDKERS